MADGVISKALSGFYYVSYEGGLLECKARGRFRLDGTSPLVGDRVQCSLDQHGKGRIDKVEPRRNWFIRPAVANIDAMVFVAANTNPVTDPFLVDRVSVIAADADCQLILCINKADIDPGDQLYSTFTAAGFPVVRTSAETGQGMEELRAAIDGKICAFTGNSGVGKSSILNKLLPGAAIPTGEVSEKLGRGRHTTRHVQLFPLSGGGYLADTPGFGSFDLEQMESVRREDLQYCFREFAPYLGRCRFNDCAHLKEPDCAVLEALQRGEIVPSRHSSYARLYEQAAKLKDWELR